MWPKYGVHMRWVNHTDGTAPRYKAGHGWEREQTANMKFTIGLLVVAAVSAAAFGICIPNKPGMCPRYRLTLLTRSKRRFFCRDDCDCEHINLTWKCCPTKWGRFCLPPCLPGCPFSRPKCTLITHVYPWRSRCFP